MHMDWRQREHQQIVREKGGSQQSILIFLRFRVANQLNMASSFGLPPSRLSGTSGPQNSISQSPQVVHVSPIYCGNCAEEMKVDVS
jgi:hypothetical protein